MKNIFYCLIFFITTIAAQETVIPTKKSKLEFATFARCLQQKRLPLTASPIAQAIDAEEEAEAVENAPILSSDEEQSDTQNYE